MKLLRRVVNELIDTVSGLGAAAVFVLYLAAILVLIAELSRDWK